MSAASLGNVLGADRAARLRVWLRRAWALTVKEYIQLFRDTILVLFMAYAFTLDIYVAGVGVNWQLNNAGLAVHDSDKTWASREVAGRFRAPYFRNEGSVSTVEEGQRLLDQGRLMVVLDFPPRFGADILRGRQTSVQMQVDTANSAIGSLATSYGGEIVGRYGLERALNVPELDMDKIHGVPFIIDETRAWYNQNQEDPWFMALAEIISNMTLLSILLPAAALAREKERGTVEQLMVSPLSPVQILAPKILAMGSVILAGLAFGVFGVIIGVFHVPVRGSLPLFFAVSALYIAFTAGIGLLIATIARNMAQVGMLTVLVFAPMIFLSGAWTPPEAMPSWMRLLMDCLPMHYMLDAGFGVLLKGQGLGELWRELLGICALGAPVLGLSLWRFRRQFG